MNIARGTVQTALNTLKKTRNTIDPTLSPQHKVWHDELNDSAQALAEALAPPDHDFERECADTDKLLRMLDLNPEHYRTEGGSLNLPKIKSELTARKAGGLYRVHAFSCKKRTDESNSPRCEHWCGDQDECVCALRRTPDLVQPEQEPVEYQILILGERWTHCAKAIYDLSPDRSTVRALYTRPAPRAQSEQKPVGDVTVDAEWGYCGVEWIGQLPVGTHNLYFHPAPPVKELSDEEIELIWRKNLCDHQQEICHVTRTGKWFARAIEAHLKGEEK